MNRQKKLILLGKSQTAFSAKIDKKIIHELPVRPILLNHKIKEPIIPIKIEEDILNLKKDSSIFYKSCYDPEFKRIVQILSGGIVAENYLCEFIDEYTTKISATQDLIDCIVRIYFCEPTLVGVLEKIDKKEEIDNQHIFEWDVDVQNFNWDKWESEIIAKNIGAPFIGGVYSMNKFSIELKDNNNSQCIFEN